MPPPLIVAAFHGKEEVAQLLKATSRLTPRGGLRPLTYCTLFGLIAAAGLRLSEALNLTSGDVDLAAEHGVAGGAVFLAGELQPLLAEGRTP